MEALENLRDRTNLEDLPDLHNGREYISEKLVYEAVKNDDYSKLERSIVLPAQSVGVKYIHKDVGDIYFSSDRWSNKHLIRKPNETFRVADFSQIKNPSLKREVKWISSSIIWWLREHKKVSKLSSIIRNIEQIIVCARVMEGLSYNSLFWLNRAPVLSSFKAKVNEGLSLRAAKNRLGALSILCELQNSSLREFECYLTINPLKELVNTDALGSNQSYAMPYRIMMEVWDGLVKRIEKWSVSISPSELTGLITFYRDFQDWFSSKPHIKSSHGLLIYMRNNQEKVLKLKENSSGVIKDVFYISIEDRWKGVTFISFQELIHIINKISLDTSNCIQCMSGMRNSETKGLYHNSLKIDRGVTVFRSWLQKWAVEGGQIEEWAAADFAGDAFNLMHSINKNILGHSVEKLDDLPFILNIKEWLYNKTIIAMTQQRQSKWGKTIAEEIDLRITEDDLREFQLLNPNLDNPERAYEEIYVGALWPLRTHQHRRSIAVHTKRLNLLSGNDRTWQFKHLTKTITDWYESYCPKENLPEAFIKEMIQADIEASVSLGLKIQEEGNLIGKGGEELMNQRGGGDSLKVFPSFKVALSQAKRRKTQLMSLGNGFYCMNGFECDFTPIIQSANCNFECPSMVGIEESIPFWKEQYERYTSLLKEAMVNNSSAPDIAYLELEKAFYEDALRKYGEI
tara:strand:+ start:10412 stop:12463 length:2052 start_codon:yes stop_codon:yes gene_type:complete